MVRLISCAEQTVLTGKIPSLLDGPRGSLTEESYKLANETRSVQIFDSKKN